jgi:hypothetical protein
MSSQVVAVNSDSLGRITRNPEVGRTLADLPILTWANFLFAGNLGTVRAPQLDDRPGMKLASLGFGMAGSRRFQRLRCFAFRREPTDAMGIPRAKLPQD